MLPIAQVIMAGLHVPATATMKGRTKLCLFPPSPRSGQGLLSRAVDGSPLYQATNMSGITIDGLRSNPVEALPDPKRSWSRSSWDVIIDESLSPIPGDESRDARRKPQACHKRTYSTNSSSSGYTGDEDQLLKTSCMVTRSSSASLDLIKAPHSPAVFRMLFKE